MKYKFKFKKGFFWKSKVVIGHQFHQDVDKMDLFLEDGSVYVIANWKDYDMLLGPDWVMVTKKNMEKEAGQAVNLNIKEA